MYYSLDCQNDGINYSFLNDENFNFYESKDIIDERLYYIEKDKSQIYDNNSINEEEAEFNDNIYPKNIFDDKNIYNFSIPNNLKNSPVNNDISIGNKKTSYSSKLLNKKTKRIDALKSKNMGRKTDDDKEKGEKGEHDKFSEDNMIRKIKSNFIDYIHNLINNSIENKELQFLKLDSEINEKLKKDYNIELMNRSFKDLYENTPISKKYKKISKENGDTNKNIIYKIYYEEPYKEFNVINLLNKTYKELFKDFVNNNLDKFLNDIKQKEKKKKESEENIINYIKNIKQLCYSYEDWYLKKKGRNRKNS